MSFKATIELLSEEQLADIMLSQFKDSGHTAIYDTIRKYFKATDDEINEFINQNRLIEDSLHNLINSGFVRVAGTGNTFYNLTDKGRQVKLGKQEGVRLHAILAAFSRTNKYNFDAPELAKEVGNRMSVSECIKLCRILIAEGDLINCNSKQEKFGICATSLAKHSFEDGKYLNWSGASNPQIIIDNSVDQSVKSGGDLKMGDYNGNNQSDFSERRNPIIESTNNSTQQAPTKFWAWVERVTWIIGGIGGLIVIYEFVLKHPWGSLFNF